MPERQEAIQARCPRRFYEYESKALFARYGVPLPDSPLVHSADEVRTAADAIGRPVVLESQVLSGGPRWGASLSAA